MFNEAKNLSLSFVLLCWMPDYIKMERVCQSLESLCMHSHISPALTLPLVAFFLVAQEKALLFYATPKDCTGMYILIYIIQVRSGITHGRVLNGELYAQKLQNLIYLHLSTDCFMEDFSPIDGTSHIYILSSSRTSVRVKLGLSNAKIRNENSCYIHRLIYQLNEQDLLCHSI